MYQVKKESMALGWVILAMCMSFPWLIPVHSEPWPTFYSEVAAGLVIVPFAIWAMCASRGKLSLDMLAMGFALAAAIPLLQLAAGMFMFPGEAWVVSLYLLGMALTMVLARWSEEYAPGRLIDTLFAGLVVASLVSTALALAQWLNLDWGPLLAAIPEGRRSVANVGQTNELSTLLVWGLLGLWWMQWHLRIAGGIAAMAAMMLLTGVASTQSRTGWLAVGVMLLVAIFAPKPLGNAKHRAIFAALGLWFVALTMTWPMLTALLDGGDANSLTERMTAGLRPEIWKMMIEGVRLSPWAGYGWNQGRLVQLSVLPDFAHLKFGVQHAHNLVLDLLVWNGVPLGIGLVTLLAGWFWWNVRRAVTGPQILLMLGLTTFMLHAMLELPHCKSFFLVPIAIFMGTLNAQTRLPVVLGLPRALAGVLAVVMTGTLGLTAVEYRHIETDLQAYRMGAAWPGLVATKQEHEVIVLSGLQTALENLRIQPRANMSMDDLERMRLTARRYPIESALYKYARAAALNKQPVAAQESLTRWCLLFSQDRCEVARSAWTEFMLEHPEIEPVPFPKLR